MLLNVEILSHVAIDNHDNKHGLNELCNEEGGRDFNFSFTFLL